VWQVKMEDPKDKDMDEDKEFSFAQWISLNAISDVGRRKLEMAEIKDEASIMLIDEVTLTTVKLAAGDFVKFKRGQQVLKTKMDKPPPLLESDGVKRVDSGDATGKVNGVPILGQSIKSTSGVGGQPLYTLDQLAAFLAGTSIGSGEGHLPVQQVCWDRLMRI
jgi:hypothetical protein